MSTLDPEGLVLKGTWIEFSLLEKFEGDFLLAAIYSELQFLDSAAKKEQWHVDEHGKCWFHVTRKSFAERYRCRENLIHCAFIRLSALGLIETKRIDLDHKKTLYRLCEVLNESAK